jgi:hypothetical protein
MSAIAIMLMTPAMPRASVKTAAMLNAGRRINERRMWRTSVANPIIDTPEDGRSVTDNSSNGKLTN